MSTVHEHEHCALVKLEPFCPLWRRQFIVVANAEWPMNRVPRTSVMRLDPSLFTGLLMFKGDFLESLVLFHDRALIPEFKSIVNLESLEDHRIVVRHHPYGLGIATDWSQWAIRAPLWWFFEIRGEIPFFYAGVDLGVLEEHDLAVVRQSNKCYAQLFYGMAPIWRCHTLVMMNPVGALSGSDSRGSDAEHVVGTPPPSGYRAKMELIKDCCMSGAKRYVVAAVIMVSNGYSSWSAGRFAWPPCELLSAVLHSDHCCDPPMLPIM
ncbi:hypothetical protein Dimus_027072 [Dionaea muscipula]